MNFLLLIPILLLAGCAMVKPPVPEGAQKEAVAGGKSQLLVLPPPTLQHHTVGWGLSLEMPVSNLVFDVEGSTNLVNWYLILTTNQPPAEYDSPNATEYIRVGAHWIDPLLQH